MPESTPPPAQPDAVAPSGRPDDSAWWADETRFQLLANLGPSMIWIGNPDGSVSFLSARWYEYTGLSESQALPLGWIEVVHPEDIDRLLEVWNAARANGTPYEFEMRLRRFDGSYRWFLGRALPWRDASGEISAWLGSNTDIHERKLLETALLTERERIWTHSPDLMSVARLDGSIEALNPAWEALLGVPTEELMRLPVTALVHPDDLPRTLQEIERLRHGHRTLNFENRYRHRDGSYRTIAWTAVPEGGFIHAIGRDVTAARAAARQLQRTEAALRQAQKMEAVGQLTGGIAHDFNNLLQGIGGALELARRRLAQGLPREAERFLDSASATVDRAATLTHRLLAFSRRQPLAPRPICPNRLLGSMEELLARTVGERISLILKPGPDLWPICCDPHQLESALLNLAINARDAMPGGGVLVISTANVVSGHADADAVAGPAAGDYVCLAVRDTGCGMPAEVLTRVFEPFFTTKPPGQGSGLGLAMIYGFVHQSGGQIQIDSEVGQGTQVRLYLPCYLGEPVEPEQGGTDRPLQDRPAAGEARVALLVEDQAPVREVVLALLQELGFTTLVAEDGLAGLAILDSAQPLDLLLTDIGLPGLDGRDMAAMARQQRPRLKILFMTGYADQAAMTEALDPDMDLIAKPFALSELARRVQDLLARSSTTPAADA